MARFPDDFDEDEIDEIKHQQSRRLGVEDVRFLSKRLGYRYVDWVHGDSLFNALSKYGEIPKAQKLFGRSRAELISMAMEYSVWLELAEFKLAPQNPHIWNKPGEMEGAPDGVPAILAELRTSIVRKLSAGDLYAIGYIQTSDDPRDWPLWVANYDDQLDFRRIAYDGEGSRLSAEFIQVRVVESLGEEILLPEVTKLKKRGRGRPSVREDIREAFHQAVNQGALIPGTTKTAAFEIIRPLALRNALRRGAKISIGPEVVRKHTTDLFSQLSALMQAKRSKTKAGPGV